MTGGTHERGAALVEMAFIAPLLLLLVIGIVEFGWKFGEYTEIRHAARDAARFAATSSPDLTGDSTFTSTDVSEAVCDALSLAASGRVDITLAQVTGDDIGDTARITVTVDTPSLSGAPIITSFLPTTLSDEVTFRLEQPADWSATTLNDQC